MEKEGVLSNGSDMGRSAHAAIAFNRTMIRYLSGAKGRVLMCTESHPPNSAFGFPSHVLPSFLPCNEPTTNHEQYYAMQPASLKSSTKEHF